MKKLLIILSLVISSLLLAQTENINECKTDIYFGNGVWNSRTQAEKSQQKLQELIDREIINNDPKLKNKYGEVKLQYNWSHGKMIDVLETFYQVKEAGQIGEETFFILVDELMAKQVSDITNEDLRSIREQLINLIESTEEDEVDKMLFKYYDKSFKYGHRVLLVSHSQGNMFANRVYEKINPTEYQKYFANLQIASPASEVKASKGDYITGFIDPAINPIPGSMKNNADLDLPGGHKFVEAYLASSDTLTKIIEGTKNLLKELDEEQSQWETDQELNKGTKDYKITVKHRFDSSITAMDGIEVYPFAPSKKLYHVKDEIGGNGWVKASCGGDEVFDYWEDQQYDEVYFLEGTEEVIIYSKEYRVDIRFMLNVVWNHSNNPYFVFSLKVFDGSTVVDSITINTYNDISCGSASSAEIRLSYDSGCVEIDSFDNGFYYVSDSFNSSNILSSVESFYNSQIGTHVYDTALGSHCDGSRVIGSSTVTLSLPFNDYVRHKIINFLSINNL